MHSLRFKFSLALIITSMSAVIVVGIIAQWRVSTRFDQMAMERAFENFQADVTAYIASYGSWNEAQQVERFDRFVRRRRMPTGRPPDEPFFSGPENRIDPAGRRLKPPMPHEPEWAPPFLFILLDPQGKVLLGGGKYEYGEFVPESARLGVTPIMLENQVLALAIPQSKPNLSAIDRNYLAIIREALIYAFVIAGTLAIFLGFLFSKRLSKSLHELTMAIRAMNQGELRQTVAVRGKDETAILAEAFNRMSADLAHAYEKLEESNCTISEQALLLKELSIRDELTQLYNRRYFNEQANKLFNQMKRYKHPLSFMIGDIDYFKQVNDKFSHAIGDEVLKAVSGILKESTRESDIVARYGGEEFVVIFPETPLIRAVEQCEKLRKKIENFPWPAIHPELQVTMSMGLNDDLSFTGFEQMLAAADKNLFQAKADGRNRVCY
ncbi:diguanylate cyclase [Methylobacter sp.]|uniref:GGDEF domain-containing protein n=1 Tax=Methylobacter sp. TaxID=2051955 RepID=UPI00122BA88F|nr:diguanylate cyclase [Methylobacter sp.]TAK62466.1 MAG: sensor domain-containing diguanylate cyclase [Methylobacter sp.]